MFAWLRQKEKRRRLLTLLVFFVALAGLGGTAYLDRLLNLGVTWGANMAPIANRGDSRLAINTFLDREPDQAKVKQSLQMAADAGFKYIRQAFPWYDIEIAGKGDYEDQRGPGAAHSAWDKYDFIVNTANSLGLELLVRLDGTPLWASPSGIAQNAIGYYKGPPANNQDFAAFAATVARRYQGKVHYYQIWNEPNLNVEWAGTPDARAYTALLQTGYTAIKSIDPTATVVMAGLAPTTDRVELGGNQDELVYLQQMYDAGAAPYFDVASVMIYGLGYDPTARFTDLRLPGDNKRVNFARVLLARAVMLKNGDSAKSLWPSEYGWISIPSDWAGKPSSWGTSVDEATQARYLIAGLERASAEWPWIGPMFVWHLRDPDPPAGEPQQFFAILNHDFSPRPAYTALAAYAKRAPIADTGAYTPAAPGATFSVSGGQIHFKGERLDLVYSADSSTLATNPNELSLHGTLDGSAPPGWPAGGLKLKERGYASLAWHEEAAQFTLLRDLTDQEHTFSFTYDGAAPQLLGFVVARANTSATVFTMAYLLWSLLVILSAVRFTGYFASGGRQARRNK